MHDEPSEGPRGLLGYFSSDQMHLIESLFLTSGEPDPPFVMLRQVQSSIAPAVVEWSEHHRGVSVMEKFCSPQVARAPLCATGFEWFM